MEKHKGKSKELSFLLRHHPEKAGLVMQSDGFVDVDGLRAAGFNMELLEEIVETDMKGRYSFNYNKSKIRANYGHSIPGVNPSIEKIGLSELSTLTRGSGMLYHGTAKCVAIDILSDGIKNMGRNFVHMSNSSSVALMTGSRHGKPVLLYVDAKQMLMDGVELYKATPEDSKMVCDTIFLAEYVDAKYVRMVNLIEVENALRNARTSIDVEIIMKALDEYCKGLFESLEISQNSKWHRYNVREHIIHTVLNCRNDLRLRLAALLHDIGKLETLETDENGINHFHGHANKSYEMSDRILNLFGFTPKDKEYIRNLIKMHDDIGYLRQDVKVATLRRYVGLYGEEFVNDLCDLRQADILAHSGLSICEDIPALEKVRDNLKEVIKDGTGVTEEQLDFDSKDLDSFSLTEKEKDEVMMHLLSDVWGTPNVNNKDTLGHLVKRYVKAEIRERKE